MHAGMRLRERFGKSTAMMRCGLLAVSLMLVLVMAAMAAQAAHLQRPKTRYPTAAQKLSKSVSSNNGTRVNEMWSDCSSSGDSVKILSISITPDPPEKGQKVMADVKLEFTEEVEAGTLNILVKYRNYYPIMNKKKNLCNIPDILEDSCPLQPGVHEATFSQKFPSYALSGTYVGKVVAKDKSGNELMCLELNFTI